MARRKKLIYEDRKYYYPHLGYPRLFVEPKQKVKKGDLLCILERLGIEESILAGEDGIVQDINLQSVGTLAQFNEYFLTLKHQVTEAELIARREEKKYLFVTAPWEASYWLTESTDSPPLIKVDAYVQQGQVISIAMIAKQKREVVSDLEGTVGIVYFTQGQVLKQGDKLFGLKKE